MLMKRFDKLRIVSNQKKRFFFSHQEQLPKHRLG